MWFHPLKKFSRGEQFLTHLCPICVHFRGDYRTGKRLNMRKVIPYIASQFRKDKIWLRRTKPSKRQYQICLAIDDSSSMADNHTKQVRKRGYLTPNHVPWAITYFRHDLEKNTLKHQLVFSEIVNTVLVHKDNFKCLKYFGPLLFTGLLNCLFLNLATLLSSYRISESDNVLFSTKRSVLLNYSLEHTHNIGVSFFKNVFITHFFKPEII